MGRMRADRIWKNTSWYWFCFLIHEMYLSTFWNVFVYILKCICLHFAMYLSTFWNEFFFILQCICLDFEMYLFRFCGEISDLSTFVVFRNPKFLHMTNVSPYPIYVRYVTNVRYELLILIFILILAISQ